MTSLIGRRAFTAALASLPAAFSRAQDSATSVIVPFAAGSVADALTRRYAVLMGEAMGAPMVVENITGASGVVAAHQFLRRPADGKTLLMAHSGLVCNAPLLAASPLDFDPVADFVPVSIFIYSPFVLFAARDFPADNLQELQRLGHSQAGALTFAGADTGSANHIAAEVLLRRLGVRGTFVPYRNSQQSFIDVVEGRVDLGSYAWANIGPLVRAGRAKVLAVLANTPLTVAPEYSTVPAQGFGTFDVQGWMGVFVARGTPRAALLELERQTAFILQRKGYDDFIVKAGQEAAFRTHAESKEFIATEVERWKAILRQLKLA